ncbi:MAG TPA: hypothetical protein VKI17_11180 [Gemmataceae bacterium]|nr:hypothetical protein [Gemmataceae bacterium]
MKALTARLRALWQEESGLEPVQYAIALALIVCMVIGGIKLVGTASNSQHNATSNMLQQASTPKSAQ